MVFEVVKLITKADDFLIDLWHICVNSKGDFLLPFPWVIHGVGHLMWPSNRIMSLRSLTGPAFIRSYVMSDVFLRGFSSLEIPKGSPQFNKIDEIGKTPIRETHYVSKSKHSLVFKQFLQLGNSIQDFS